LDSADRQERRQEEQRRRTQEIKLTREELERLPLTLNGTSSTGVSGPNSVSGSGSDRLEGSPRYCPYPIQCKKNIGGGRLFQ